MMPKTVPDYSETIIYKLCCLNSEIKDIYIGHTTNFTKRKNQHKTSSNNPNYPGYNTYVYKFIREHGGWDNWKMVQIEECDCKNKREAESFEQEYIEKLGATLNCVNPYAQCVENPEAYKQQWYEEHKNEILEKKKENYVANKPQFLEKMKEYAEAHKEEIKEYQQEYQKENKQKISATQKVYREAHKEEISQTLKDWRETNKDKIKEQRQQIVTCECGHQHTFGNKHAHLKTQFHIDYENAKNGIVKEDENTEEKMQQKKEEMKIKQKEYRDQHAEQIKQSKKKYNDTHKEKNAEQKQQYYKEHRDQILEQSKQYVEENKQKIKENQQKYYQAKKEQILEKQKTTFVCECGSTIRYAGISEHLRSGKHTSFMESKKANDLPDDALVQPA